MESLDHGSSIAIIGMTCRFPGARDLATFWQNLCCGRESITFFSEQELAALGVEPAMLHHAKYVKAGGVIEDIELFDAAFFGFSPREAVITDPQHRLFLECAWETLEAAGYNPDTYTQAIGVFAGTTLSTYLLHFAQAQSLVGSIGSPEFYSAFIGNSTDYLATRVSYKLNLTGPSVNVQTACSTSLVATHLACQSLLNGECDMALAGGISVRVPHKVGYLYREGGVYAPDGHCRAFDAKGQGTVFGHGAGLVLLKRLDEALADRDTIYAVIRGSAINNDGSAKAGYTAPSVDGQLKVILEAQGVADVDPATITYLEAHGTGTPLGDPIEIAALAQAFRAKTAQRNYCALGSVKTNIGHLDAAAGVAGLIKTALALKYQLLPPSLHFAQPNPNIDFAASPFYVNTQLQAWETAGMPRRAGVSSFGFGGTNAHAVLEEAPPLEPISQSRPWHLLQLSARTSAALETMTTNLAEHLGQHPELEFADVAYTLHVGRKVFPHRRMLVCQSLPDAIHVLQTRDPARLFTSVQETQGRPVIFLFPGQGAQYAGMAAGLYATEPVFHEQVELCASLLQPLLGLDIRTLLFPSAERQLEAEQQLAETALTQPALFVIEYALAQLWLAWGVQPQAMLGHSLGEYVAACLAQVFSLQDALKLVTARGKLMQQCARGSMLTVPLPEAQVQALLGAQLSLAAINGPAQCVVAGSDEAIEHLQQHLTATGLTTRRLVTSHAFHSALMEPMLDAFAQEVQRMRLSPPTLAYLSNVTGTWIKAEEATDPAYWVRHARATVRFADGIKEILQAKSDAAFLEVGPGQSLSSLVRQQVPSPEAHALYASLPRPQRTQEDLTVLLHSLGRLWQTGVEVDWQGFYALEQRQRVPLPTYPFERQRYWLDAPQPHFEQHAMYAQEGEAHPLIGRRLHTAEPLVQFEAQLNAQTPAYLRDHQIYGTVVLPATAYLEMALAAATSLRETSAHVVTEIAFKEALIFLPEETRTVQTTIVPVGTGEVLFHVYSSPVAHNEQKRTWTLHATGKIAQMHSDQLTASHNTLSVEAVQQRCTEIVSVDDFYRSMRERGTQFGPTFQGIQQIWRRDGEALGYVQLPEPLHTAATAYQVHPAFLDACNQVLAAALPISGVHAATGNAFLPQGCEMVKIYRHPDTRLWSHAQLRNSDEANVNIIEGDVWLFNAAGQLVMELCGLRHQRLGQTSQRARQPNPEEWLYTMQWQPLAALAASSSLSETALAEQPRGRWLLFGDHTGTTQAVVARLEAAGNTCIVVEHTLQQAVATQGKPSIDLTQYERVQQYLAPLLDARSAPCGVVYCAGLDAEESDIGVHAATIALLHVLQALAGKRIATKFWLVTRGAQFVGAEQHSVSVAQATLWGLAKASMFEHPELQCACIDLDPAGQSEEGSALLTQLLTPDKENQVALRGQTCYIPRLQRYTLPQASIATPPEVQPLSQPTNLALFRPDGTYLITGGLGGLGLQVAQWMAQQGARHLVLVGRSPATSEINAEIQAMAQQDVHILVRQADVSHKQDLEKVLAEIQTSCPPLRGVIHAAGLLDDDRLLNLDRERFSRVLAPKVDGAWHLHTLTEHLPLDFCVFFSSLVSVVGSFGQGNYIAANTFLDALTQQRALQHLPCISINWGPWAEVGMAARAYAHTRHHPLAGTTGMIPLRQGFTLLERLLRANVSQVAVLPDLAGLLKLYPMATDMPMFTQLLSQGHSATGQSMGATMLHPRPDLANAYVAPRNETEQAIAEVWQEVLGIAQIGVYDSFFDLGGHSLLAPQILSALRKMFPLDIPLQSLFEYATIGELAQAIEALLIARLETLTEEEVTDLLSREGVATYDR